MRYAAAIITILILAGCAGAPMYPPEERVRGVLKHYPAKAKSVEAWYGHNFKVGDTPVQPSDIVPEAELKKYVGQNVIVTGIWHPGEQWKPTAEDESAPVPVQPVFGVVFRKDGIRPTRIRSAALSAAEAAPAKSK